MQNLAIHRCSPLPGIRTTPVVALRYGFQPVVERPGSHGKTVADHTEPASVVECEGGVEATQAGELHVRKMRVRVKEERGSKLAFVRPPPPYGGTLAPAASWKQSRLARRSPGASCSRGLRWPQ